MAKQSTTFTLQEGMVLTAEDVAKFLNVSYSTFRKKSKEYWNLFGEYCKYEKIKAGKFEVKEIIEANFELESAGKAKVKKAREVEESAFVVALDKTGRLTTVREIIEVVKEEKLLVKEYAEKTVSNKMYDAKKSLYGTDGNKDGSKGHTEQVWTKRDENGEWVVLEGEELVKFNSYIRTYFDARSISEKLATLALDFANGDISCECYAEKSKMVADPAKSFPEIYEKFKAHTGIEVQRRSLFIDHVSFI